ncbi:hypothetical protein E0H70_28215 [Rhizobium leguminosarum bv. viciae]|nr:hypothetical protein E0H70_28215 [Rhizobium leguminosarum bv. viciae]
MKIEFDHCLRGMDRSENGCSFTRKERLEYVHWYYSDGVQIRGRIAASLKRQTIRFTHAVMKDRLRGKTDQFVGRRRGTSADCSALWISERFIRANKVQKWLP